MQTPGDPTDERRRAAAERVSRALARAAGRAQSGAAGDYDRGGATGARPDDRADAPAAPGEQPVREIFDPPRDPQTDLVIQTRENTDKRAVYEARRRMHWAAHMFYADPTTGLTHTYDPEGRYNCGRCNQATPELECLLVSVAKVDPEAGSCAHWERIRPCDPEPRLRHKLTPEQANYAIAANGRTWGCDHCPIASQAYMPDIEGRALYCGEADTRVLATGCCQINALETVPIDEQGMPVGGARVAAGQAPIPAARLTAGARATDATRRSTSTGSPSPTAE